MESLPDPALIRIFSYLETDHLISHVRAVCKRWRELSLDADAWKSRTLDNSLSRNMPMVVQALKVAPCIRTFFVDIEYFKPIKGLVRQACSTNCAARELDMQISPGSIAANINLIKNQLKLGRLRRLKVDFYCRRKEIRKMLAFIGNLHLDELNIHYACEGDPLEMLPDDLSWGHGSCKSLDFSGVDLNSELMACLLLSRAQSVEEVGFSMATRSECSAPQLSVLTECRKLKTLSLPAVVEVADLLACRNLTSLTMNIGISPFQPFPTELEPALRIFFQDAVFLTELCLVCLPLRPAPCAMVMEMVATLASSGRSALEKLKIGTLSDVDPPLPCTLEDFALMGRSPFDVTSDCSLLDKLPSVLPGLPKLRRLRLFNSPSVKTLDSITREVTPNLERFKVSGPFLCGPLTPQHVEAVSRLVKRLPGLHAQVRCLTSDCSRCKATLGPQAALGFFAHSAAQVCKTHDVGVEWRSVNDD